MVMSGRGVNTVFAVSLLMLSACITPPPRVTPDAVQALDHATFPVALDWVATLSLDSMHIAMRPLGRLAPSGMGVESPPPIDAATRHARNSAITGRGLATTDRGTVDADCVSVLRPSRSDSESAAMHAHCPSKRTTLVAVGVPSPLGTASRPDSAELAVGITRAGPRGYSMELDALVLHRIGHVWRVATVRNISIVE